MSAGPLVSSKEITDPKYRRLRKALRRAEDFVHVAARHEEKWYFKRACDRWNSIMIKAWKVMK